MEVFIILNLVLAFDLVIIYILCLWMIIEYYHYRN